MTDEEKKAIEWLKKADWFSARLYSPYILNLIEKQSKEIEALKLIHESYKEMIEENNFISKDKIKAKIEEIDEILYYGGTEEGMAELKDYEYDEAKYGKKVLQSLLEEE